MSDGRRYFFVHIMRTGGGTFSRQIEWNFAPGEVYPDRNHDPDMHKANFDIPYLLSLAPERLETIRAYTGHFPFYVTELMPGPPSTMTILRDPVQRTISYLQQQLHDDPTARSIEDIYDNAFVNWSMIRNFQTRQFAMRADDQLRCAMDALDMDEDRLALAKENLTKVDVLGLQERYGEFMEAVNARFGWKSLPIPNWHVSEPVDVAPALRERIVEDNAIDIAFYEHAVHVYDQRRRHLIRP